MYYEDDEIAEMSRVNNKFHSEINNNVVGALEKIGDPNFQKI